MKKILLSLAAFSMVLGSANAQVWSEDFQGASPLTPFTLHGTSGVTVTTDAGVAGYGLSGTTFWAVSNGTGLADNAAVTTSWFNTVVQADNYLVTPAINLPGGSSYSVSWNAQSLGNNNYLDPYKVMISSTGTAKANFSTTLYTNTAGAPNTGEDQSAVIPAGFVGGNVYIAFIATGSDDYVLAFDDLVVDVLPNDDIELVSVGIDPIITAGNYSITGTVKNNGANTITSFDVDWNDGTAHNQTITQTIAPGATYNFTHPTTLTAVAGNTYTIDVCATVTGDAVAGNNCINGTTTTVATQAGTRMGLVEIFTSSTCPPCFTFNENFNLATGATSGGPGFTQTLEDDNANAQSNPGIAVIKNQVNWPGAGDHAHNSHISTRTSYYGVSAAPTPILNGIDITGGNWWEITQAQYDAAKAEPAFIDITASHTISGNDITVDVAIDPYANFSNCKLHIAVLDDHYAAGGSGDNFTNGESDFYHIARRYLPSASGQTVNLTAGNQHTDTESYTMTTVSSGFPAQGSFDMHNGSTREVIVFVQAASGEVLNAAVSTFSSGIGFDENEAISQLSVYPNPAVEMTTVQFNLEEASNVTIEMYNAVGQIVYSNNLGEVNGMQSIEIGTSNLEAGIYMINMNVDGDIITRKVSVTK